MSPADAEPQIVIAAANLLSRAGLAAVLEERGCVVLAQSDGADLDVVLDRWTPDALVVDLGWRGETLCRALDSIDGAIPVLALLAHDESDELLQIALQALVAFPAYALLPREADPETMIGALEALAQGLITLHPGFGISLTLPAKTSDAPAILTPRENETLQLLAGGLTNRAIALELGISLHTVKFHVNAIMSKLGAQSRTEAVVRATRLGLIAL